MRPAKELAGRTPLRTGLIGDRGGMPASCRCRSATPTCRSTHRVSRTRLLRRCRRHRTGQRRHISGIKVGAVQSVESWRYRGEGELHRRSPHPGGRPVAGGHQTDTVLGKSLDVTPRGGGTRQRQIRWAHHNPVHAEQCVAGPRRQHRGVGQTEAGTGTGNFSPTPCMTRHRSCAARSTAWRTCPAASMRATGRSPTC